MCTMILLYILWLGYHDRSEIEVCDVTNKVFHLFFDLFKRTTTVF